MSHLHLRDVAAAGHALSHHEMTVSSGGQIMVIHHRGPQGPGDSSVGEVQISAEEAHSEEYHDNTGGGELTGGETGIHVPSTVSLVPGQTTTNTLHTMSHLHLRDVAAAGHALTHQEMTVSSGGQIMVIHHGGPQGPRDSNVGEVQISAEEAHSEEYHDNTGDGELMGGETGVHVPSTVSLMPGQTTNVQLIGQDGASEHAIILTYPASVADHSASSPPAPDTTDYQKPCLICGDKGSGFHYSAFSCEGCKGFFKRTVQKTLAYNCKGEGECVINKYTRNSCQHCRFTRCLEVGMKREAVREDRSPGGKHRHKRQKLDGSAVVLTERFASASPITPSTKLADRSVFRDPLLDSLVQAKPFLIPKVEGNMSLDSLSINELMQYGYMELRYIIEWAKKVPGFKGLGVDDQMALLKSAFMELNVLRLSYRSLEIEGHIKFAEGLTVPIDYATSIGWGKELITATADFATRLRDIFMDETEFCTLNAIVLTYPDATGIQDKHQVTGLQTQMLDLLRKYTAHTYPDDHRRFGKMLLRLPALRTVSAKAAERFLSLTLDGNIQLGALVSELMS